MVIYDMVIAIYAKKMQYKIIYCWQTEVPTDINKHSHTDHSLAWERDK